MVKSNRFLEVEESTWLFEHGYTIRSSWISPQEGYEYRLSHIGESKVIAFRTTMRGCYNAAKKHAAQHLRALDAALPSVTVLNGNTETGSSVGGGWLPRK